MTDTLLALIRNPETPTWLLREAVMDAQVHSVWVVEGITGEYSDRRSWSVAAFLDDTQADALVNKLNQWCKEMKVDWVNGSVDYDYRDGLKCPLDPDFDCDYTGVLYRIRQVPLRAEE